MLSIQVSLRFPLQRGLSYGVSREEFVPSWQIDRCLERMITGCRWHILFNRLNVVRKDDGLQVRKRSRSSSASGKQWAAQMYSVIAACRSVSSCVMRCSRDHRSTSGQFQPRTSRRLRQDSNADGG
jgi:hypothetical protein